MIGVDEAGRGPVLGSMFVAAVSVDEEYTFNEEITDSKELSHRKIIEISRQVQETPAVTYSIIEVPVVEIDESESLTDLTIEKFSEAINNIASPGEEVYADACLSDTTKFSQILQPKIKEKLQLTAENNADSTYKIVGLASILAKNAREKHIKTLKENYGAVGSGYPSDPTTQDFLRTYIKENGEPPSFARRSWSTTQNILDQYSQSNISSF